MLPFFAAGGAISGSSFGLFYTILMQVGYNYFGKRVLKGLNEGGNLKQLLWEVQQEIQPFSDSMLDMALASMPDVAIKTAQALANAAEVIGAEAVAELKRSWLLEAVSGGMPKGAESSMLAYAKYQLAQGVKKSPPSLGLSSEERRFSPLQLQAMEKQKNYELALERQRVARANMPKQPSIVPQVRIGVTKKVAGQSQRMEKLKLVREIALAGAALKQAMRIRVGGQRFLMLRKKRDMLAANNRMRVAQQSLTNLLTRYSF